MKKMKKIKAILIVACMFMCLLHTTAFAADYTASYDLSNGSVVIEEEGKYHIYQSDETPTENTITVRANCTVVLDGVNILVPSPASVDDYNKPNPFNIDGTYRVVVSLVDGTVNTLKSGEGYYNSSVFADDLRLACSSGKAGLRVPQGAELTINGNTGVLNTYGASGVNKSKYLAWGGSGAGIGGDGGYETVSVEKKAENSGKIIINGGEINAVGGLARSYWGGGAAGIGGGGGKYYKGDDTQVGGSSDEIIINGGIINAASGKRGDGDSEGNAIGAGCSGNRPENAVRASTSPVKINGGNVTINGLLENKLGGEIFIANGATLNVAGNSKIINDGGAWVNNGTIVNDGEIICNPHQISEVAAKEATCVAGNKKYYKCDVCGKSFEDEDGSIAVEISDVIIPANGAHKYEWVIDKEATATEKGKKHEECVICHDKKNYVDIAVIENDKTNTDNTNTDNTNNSNDINNNTAPETFDGTANVVWIMLVALCSICVVAVKMYDKKKDI